MPVAVAHGNENPAQDFSGRSARNQSIRRGPTPSASYWARASPLITSSADLMMARDILGSDDGRASIDCDGPQT
jgi:hypothetical protein